MTGLECVKVTRIGCILEKVATVLKLTSTDVQESWNLYEKVIVGEGWAYKTATILAACVLHAVRGEDHHAPITVPEIARSFQQVGHWVTPRLILRDYTTCKKYTLESRFAKSSEHYLDTMIARIAAFPGMAGRAQQKAGLPLAQYVQALTTTTRHLVGGFPMWQRGGAKPALLSARLIYVADRVLARKWGTPGVLTQEILAAATGVAKTSIRDQEQYFRRHLKGKRFIEFWEGQGGLLDDVRGS